MRALPMTLVTLSVLAAGCTGTSTGQGSAPSRVASPWLKVEVVTGGLEHGWDVGFLPDGKVLLTQRRGQLTLLSGSRPGATATEVRADFSRVNARGEGGLMGLLVHPDFATSRRFVTCQAHWEGNRAVDIRVISWRLASDGTSAERVRDLVTGMPVNPSGRHSGCRMALAADGNLLIGTGDTARNGIAQDRNNLGGKVLRVNLATGEPASGNPFASSANRNESLLWTYGHRNVQGVAPRPGSDQVFVAEHGPYTDDEVNLLRSGANYGWAPTGSPNGYDESVPMTDIERFPDAVPAIWSSGRSTEAVCAAEFLAGDGWGDLNGVLAVTALKGSKLLLFTLNADGTVRHVATPPELNDTHGRLRAARLGPDGALYVTTSNGKDDKLLRITRG